MSSVSAVEDKRTRCPRCDAPSTIQSAIELRHGVQYLTLRCTLCGLVHDAQMSSAPSMAPEIAEVLPAEPSVEGVGS
jgi:transcription elongation factor Elf1